MSQEQGSRPWQTGQVLLRSNAWWTGPASFQIRRPWFSIFYGKELPMLGCRGIAGMMQKPERARMPEGSHQDGAIPTPQGPRLLWWPYWHCPPGAHPAGTAGMGRQPQAPCQSTERGRWAWDGKATAHRWHGTPATHHPFVIHTGPLPLTVPNSLFPTSRVLTLTAFISTHTHRPLPPPAFLVISS